MIEISSIDRNRICSFSSLLFKFLDDIFNFGKLARTAVCALFLFFLFVVVVADVYSEFYFIFFGIVVGILLQLSLSLIYTPSEPVSIFLFSLFGSNFMCSQFFFFSRSFVAYTPGPYIHVFVRAPCMYQLRTEKHIYKYIIKYKM